MSDDIQVMPTSYFALYDILATDTFPPDSNFVENFDSLTGGEQEIGMIAYTQVDANGGSNTMYMPGQITYKPVVLLRAFDGKTMDMYNKFKASVEGRLLEVRSNFSIVMIDYVGGPQMVWNLYNAIPSAITGFSFNQTRGEYYTSFEITFQAERIEMVIPS